MRLHLSVGHHNLKRTFFFCSAVRVLQYRSVAFVTYVSEHHAQFAKEAMACQSLDNDEILNVRWATEDPNPTSKVAEKRRLEEIGQAAIKARMDPRVVDAMQSVRALEEGREYHAEDDLMDEDLEAGGDGPEGKRRRIEMPETDDPEGMEEPSEPQEQRPQGLLNSETLESLRYFSELRRQNGAAPAPVPAPSTKVQRPAAGLGLGDYGSEDED